MRAMISGPGFLAAKPFTARSFAGRQKTARLSGEADVSTLGRTRPIFAIRHLSSGEPVADIANERAPGNSALMFASIIFALAGPALLTVQETDQQRWVIIRKEPDSVLLLDKTGVHPGRNQQLWLRLVLDNLQEDGTKTSDYLEDFDCDRLTSRPKRIVKYGKDGVRIGEACGSAWKKAPGSGVIGVEKRPLILVI